MEKLVKIDDETPIENYPNYLGHIWEANYDSMDLIKELSFLKEIFWSRYEELAAALDDTSRHINIKFSGSSDKRLIGFDASEHLLANVLDSIPSVDVRYDDFSDDPTISGFAHIFFLKDGYKLHEAVNDINEASKALIADYNHLEDKTKHS